MWSEGGDSRVFGTSDCVEIMMHGYAMCARLWARPMTLTKATEGVWFSVPHDGADIVRRVEQSVMNRECKMPRCGATPRHEPRAVGVDGHLDNCEIEHVTQHKPECVR